MGTSIVNFNHGSAEAQSFTKKKQALRRAAYVRSDV